jgi:hypothetical protein
MNLTRKGWAGLCSAAAAAVVVFAGPQAFAGVTIGAANSGNCYPFSCGPTDGLTEYQEAYNQSAFSGVTSFDTISFTALTSAVAGPSMDTGTYAVSFYLSTEPVGSLSSNLASNEGALLGNFGVFTLGGAMPSTLSLTGSSITYDPSQGNLLMDVSISGGTSYNGTYNQFFNADITGTDVSRAWNSSTYGAFGDATGGLQTTFSTAGAVPEPAAWTMMLLGLGLIGGGLRLARRRPGVAPIAA